MKVSDKLSKVSQSFTVNLYDNGFMIDIDGRDDNDDWTSSKIIVSSEDELVTLVKEIVSLPRD